MREQSDIFMVSNIKNIYKNVAFSSAIFAQKKNRTCSDDDKGKNERTIKNPLIPFIHNIQPGFRFFVRNKKP